MTFCNSTKYIYCMEFFRSKKGTIFTIYALFFLAVFLSRGSISYPVPGRTEGSCTAGSMCSGLQTAVRYQALPLQISNTSSTAVHFSEKSLSYHLPVFMQAGIAVCICILAAICQFLFQSDKTVFVNKYKRVVSALQTLR